MAARVLSLLPGLLLEFLCQPVQPLKEPLTLDCRGLKYRPVPVLDVVQVQLLCYLGIRQGVGNILQATL